jgi:hypothetical protein
MPTLGENGVASTLEVRRAQRLEMFETRLVRWAIMSHEDGIGHTSERRLQWALACEASGSVACRMQVDGASLG